MQRQEQYVSNLIKWVMCNRWIVNADQWLNLLSTQSVLIQQGQPIWNQIFSPLVFNQGEEGTSWYIILKGSVNVVIYGKVGIFPHEIMWLLETSNWLYCSDRDVDSSPSNWSVCCPGQGVVCTLHEGDDFGKLALVNDAPRAASIVLREDNCHFLRVDKEDFNRILRVSVCLKLSY